MSKAQLKALLAKSKAEPVNCALGLDKEKQAVILLHKTKPAMALVKDLEAAAGPLGVKCHGTALVDVELDPKLVVVTVNRAPGGMAARLKKALKGTGYSKVSLRLEDGTVADEAAGEEDDEDAAGRGDAVATPGPDAVALAKELAPLIGRIAAVAGADAGLKARLAGLAQAANVRLKAGEGAEAAGLIAELRTAMEAGPALPGVAEPAAGMDAGALRAELAGLIGRVAGADAASKAKLAKLATDATASLKAGDLAGTGALIAALRQQLDAMAGSGAGAAPGGGAAGVDVLEVWLTAKEEVGGQISRLQDVLRGQKHPLFDRIADQGLNGITGRLQTGLQAALMDVSRSSGAGQDAARAKARKATAGMRDFLRTDKVVPFLESNPLGVSVRLRATLMRALDTIDRGLIA